MSRHRVETMALDLLHSPMEEGIPQLVLFK